MFPIHSLLRLSSLHSLRAISPLCALSAGLPLLNGYYFTFLVLSLSPDTSFICVLALVISLYRPYFIIFTSKKEFNLFKPPPYFSTPEWVNKILQMNRISLNLPSFQNLSFLHSINIFIFHKPVCLQITGNPVVRIRKKLLICKREIIVSELPSVESWK